MDWWVRVRGMIHMIEDLVTIKKKKKKAKKKLESKKNAKKTEEVEDDLGDNRKKFKMKGKIVFS